MEYGTLDETHEGSIPDNIRQEFDEFGFCADFFDIEPDNSQSQ